MSLFPSTKPISIHHIAKEDTLANNSHHNPPSSNYLKCPEYMTGALLLRHPSPLCKDLYIHIQGTYTTALLLLPTDHPFFMSLVRFVLLACYTRIIVSSSLIWLLLLFIYHTRQGNSAPCNSASCGEIVIITVFRFPAHGECWDIETQ